MIRDEFKVRPNLHVVDKLRVVGEDEVKGRGGCWESGFVRCKAVVENAEVQRVSETVEIVAMRVRFGVPGAVTGVEISGNDDVVAGVCVESFVDGCRDGVPMRCWGARSTVSDSNKEWERFRVQTNLDPKDTTVVDFGGQVFAFLGFDECFDEQCESTAMALMREVDELISF